MQAMRLASVLLVLAASASCTPGSGAAGHVSRPGVQVPAAVASTPPLLALQTVPPGSVAHWGGGGQAMALVGPGCDVALVDVAGNAIAARLHACGVWPSPTEDLFLARMRDGMVGVWDGHGDQRGLLAADDRSNNAPVWSPDGRHVALLFPRGIAVHSSDDWSDVQHFVIDDDSAWPHWSGTEGSFRADGAQLVVSDGRRLLLAHPGGSGALSPLPTGCSQVSQAIFSPRGDSLAVECAGGHDAEIWDTRTGQLVATVPHFAAWDPTGRRILGRDGLHLDVHDASTGQRLLRVDARSGDPFAMSPDGDRLALESADGDSRALAVWDVGSARELARMPGRLGPAWSADGRFLAASAPSSGDTDRVVLETVAWREVWRGPLGSRLAWSPGGGRLAITGDGPSLRLDDLETGATRSLHAAFSVPFADTSSDAAGNLVARLAGGDACRDLRLDAGGSPSFTEAACSEPFGIESPDGTKRTRFTRTRVSAMTMGSWELYVDDASTGEHAFVDHGWMMNPVLVWSRRGHRLLVVQDRALLFEVDGRRAFAIRVSGTVRAAALDADGTRAALSMMDGSLLVVHPKSREAPIVLHGPVQEPGQARLLAFEGEHVASVTARGEVSIWDVSAKAPVAQWRAGLEPDHVALAAEGRLLALSGAGSLRLSRLDGSGALTITPLSVGGTTTFVVSDEAGHVEGPGEALALVRWRSPETSGESRWLDALEAEPTTVRPGMLAALARDL